MAFETNFCIKIGNLADKPETRFLASGVSVTTGRLAVNESYTGKDGQKVENTYWFDFQVWREHGENVAASLNKGDRVIVIGKERKRSYTNKDGQEVWVVEIDADEVAPSLRWARIDGRVAKQSGRNSNGGGARMAQQGGYASVGAGAGVDDDAHFSGGGDFDIDDGPTF